VGQVVKVMGFQVPSGFEGTRSELKSGEIGWGFECCIYGCSCSFVLVMSL